MTRWRSAAAVAAIALTAASCTGDGIGVEFGSPAPSPSTDAGAIDGGSPGLALDVVPVDTGKPTASAAMRAMCVGPEPTSTDDDGAPADTPPDVRAVESQVEQVRELDFLHRVAVQPVSAAEIAGKLEGVFDETYPEEFYDRRSVAWQTVGVIPRDTTIRDALLAFQTGQVIGFYNPVDGELVYRADGEFGAFERITLAHELTHAIDDQHFDLGRIDGIAAGCRDEALAAAIGAVEGSAQFFSVKVLFEFPPEDGDFSGLDGGGGLPDGVPPFVADLQLWPYTAGQAFVTDLEARGGVSEIDGALRDFPVTTEQVIHPERYPGDTPSRVDVPDLSSELGQGWGDLDVMQVGEAWLAAMLSLRLAPSAAEAAAAGWDGGIYRAFTDGEDALVVFDTAWDGDADAHAFAQAMREWLDAAGSIGSVASVADRHVTVAFATDAALLSRA
ncbi:MAG: hypothetical protein OEV60_01815 [Actinomycetota bacterium]|nr:hypothetical protein [Actinomycetota bacterium]MDH5224590.1 hypothetical protein [Actinomycetota bacterium]MDH5312354.1 hypothetical protein [Actinomycetota bacterium]